MNNKIPLFEEFVPVGFGMNNSQPYSISGTATPTTGYSMDAIVGPVTDLSSTIAENAYQYESDEDPSHKGEDFIKEAKSHINKKIDEAYNNKIK